MSRNFQWCLLWISASTAGAVLTLTWLPAAFDGQIYYPVGADSFYHARRILDTVAAPHEFYEFDPYIHAPEGSLLTWPWAYNWLAAQLIRAVLALTDIGPPLKILVYLPLLMLPVNLGLLVLLCRILNFQRWTAVLVAMCYAGLPLTRELHAVGRIDHHFLEHFFFLAYVVAIVHWTKTESRVGALTTGAVLGLAPGFHCGLIVLQGIYVLTILLLYARGKFGLGPGAKYFAGAFTGAGVLVLLPSEALWLGRFELYYLAGLHVFSGLICLALTLTLAQQRKWVPAAIIVLPLIAAACGLVWDQIHHGARFVGAALPSLGQMMEAQSVLGQLLAGAHASMVERYSALIYLMPLFWLATLCLIIKRAPAYLLSLAIAVSAGGLLLWFQLRLHYFGTLALLAPLALLAESVARRVERLRWGVGMVSGLAALAAYIPVFATYGTFPALGGDANYQVARPLLAKLGERCVEKPGVVLAHFGHGHWLRYHTQCQVIANNMIMTPQHFEKIALTQMLLDTDVQTLRRSYPNIRYVFLTRQDNPLIPTVKSEVMAQNPSLARQLLLGKAAHPSVELLGKVSFQLADGTQLPFAAAYEIQ
ncbi:MAG: hypothetical protein AAF384_16375 [Pseudomonadota bacterium]